MVNNVNDGDRWKTKAKHIVTVFSLYYIVQISKESNSENLVFNKLSQVPFLYRA
jgi:hypothetical protein